MRTPQEIVFDLFYGRWRSQTTYVGTRLGIFERVGSVPTRADDIAVDLGLNPAMTYRLLRALAALELLQEETPRSFAATEAGRMLRGDHPQSMRDALLLREGPEHTAVWKHLAAIVTDGRQDGFVREFGSTAFEYTAISPSYGRAFDAAMSSQSAAQTLWSLEALADCDLGSVQHLCDVGGGQGHLLGHLLARYRNLAGTVFERPGVIEGPGPWAERLAVADRCRSATGDMFVDVPTADAYILKMILHDWSDDECRQILGNLNRRVAEGGRLFIAEHIVPADGRPDFAALFDMHMLCWGTGQERTDQQYRDLLEQTGWAHVATRFPQSRAMGVVEAVKAPVR